MSVKLPTAPRWIGGLTKKSLFSPLKKFKKFFNKGTYNKKKTSYLMIGVLPYSSTMDPAWPVICCKLKLKITLFYRLFCCKRQTVPFLFFLFFFHFFSGGKNWEIRAVFLINLHQPTTSSEGLIKLPVKLLPRLQPSRARRFIWSGWGECWNDHCSCGKGFRSSV